MSDAPKKPVKPKRMFVLVEVNSTISAKEVAAEFQELAMAGLTIEQVHVNVARPATKPAE